MKNPVYSVIDVNITSAKSATYRYKIVNSQGQILVQGTILCEKGINRFQEEVFTLANGQYYFIVDNAEEMPITKSFIKVN